MSTKWVFAEMFDRLPARRLDDQLTFRGTAYIAALGVWAVIGLVCWLVTLVT